MEMRRDWRLETSTAEQRVFCWDRLKVLCWELRKVFGWGDGKVA
jgi:hypothetical protein